MSRVRLYYYRVLPEHGRIRSGFYRIAVEHDLSARIRLENEYNGAVVTLLRVPAPLAAFFSRASGFLQHEPGADDMAGFLRDLGVMTRAGIPQTEALRTIIEESETSGTQAITRIARHLYEDLDAGATVSEAFNRHPDVFSETVRNLISIGDQSGNLDRMLIEAAEHCERMINIRRDIRTAMIYPAFVFATIIAVAIFWISYVVPTLGDLFRQLNTDLPAVTTGLVAFSEQVADHILLVLAGVLLGIVTLGWLSRHYEPFRTLLHNLAHKLPVARVLSTSSGMAALTEHLAILSRSGLDMATSLRILTRSTSDLYYRQRLEQVHKAVIRGESIGLSMRDTGGFPAMAVRMITVGEESGTLDEQLEQLAAEYRKRLDVTIRSIAEILKPAIILVAGGLFAFLVSALLLPVYDLIQHSMLINGG